MKKILTLIYCSIFTQISFANEVIFYNKDSVYPIEVHYYLCKSFSNPRICGLINTVIINPQSKVFITPASNDVTLSIISAIEKNPNGKMIAQGNYRDAIDKAYYCGLPFLVKEEDRRNGAFIFEDLNGSDAIICSQYLY